jgi:hypothetical protein
MKNDLLLIGEHGLGVEVGLATSCRLFPKLNSSILERRKRIKGNVLVTTLIPYPLGTVVSWLPGNWLTLFPVT